MAFEEGFDIEISNEEAEKIRTPRMYYEIEQRKLSGCVPEMSPDELRLKARRIICEQLGVRDDFSDDADFVEDLGAD